MSSSEQDLARRILTAVLERLEGSKQPLAALPTGNPATTQSPAVTVVVLGDVNLSSDVKSATGSSPTVHPAMIAALHPSQHRFVIPETDPPKSEPKMCVLEPQQVCIGCGACQMLGH